MEQAITLDVRKRAGKFSRPVELDLLRRGEKGNVPLTVCITKDGAPYDLTGKEVYLRSKTSQGRVVFDDVESGIAIVNAKGGVVSHTLPPGFASEPGAMVGYYEVRQGDFFLDTTESFTASVVHDIDLSAEAAADYIPKFDRITAEAQTATAAANDAAKSASETNESVKSAEAERAEQERARVGSESSRAEAEAARAKAETSRASEEGKRATAEAGRASGEASRQSAETSRVAEEGKRASAEADRASKEAARRSAETSRASEEGKRATSEAGRASSENARQSAEAARVEQEGARNAAESVRAGSEAARAKAESSRVAEEGKRATSEAGRASAENARATKETARQSAEAARAKAESARATEQAKNNADQALNNAAMAKVAPYICAPGEYDASTLMPTISGEPNRTYFVPAEQGPGNKYIEWMLIGGSWEMMGVSQVDVTAIATDQIDQVAADGSPVGESVLNLSGLSYLWAKVKAAFAAKVHRHSAADVTGGVLPVKFGGTGATTSAGIIQAAGVTATAQELNYMDGVTSNVQGQLNGKAAASHAHSYAGSSTSGGAATSAVKLHTARSISLSGDATGSVNFDGSANVQIALAIAALAVKTGMIADSAITAAKILDGTITTAELANLAVTSAKIADGAVTSAKIADGTISTADLANAAITNAKLGNGSVSAAKLEAALLKRITDLEGFRDSVSQSISHYHESVVSEGTNNGKDIWSNAELANKLGVPASRINKQTCMVSAMNGDLHATSSLAFAWINNSGGLSVQAGTAGAYRFDIHVIFVGL
ncbi:MAG: BppU family phage baseplate upper protein [Paraeggerthella sp.]|nr:BppU family phage baseplate upper protein [Paraeggerthella sp.]